ncbi:MAG: S41 family peptidase [Eubacteriaceae bacterium]|nr:S41 family peptidase [Eubacteriaceae bacterium]
MKDFRKKGSVGLWALIIVLLLLVTNMGTFLLCKYYPAFIGINDEKGDDVTSANVEKLTYIIDKLKENYLWEIDENEMWDSVFKGLMGGIGDDYAEYMTKAEYEEYQQTLTGSYSGIGVQITNNDDGNVYVTKVYKDTPAHQAGILPGDVITKAGQTDLIGVSVTTAVTFIRGETGSSVTLTVLRGQNYLTFDVIRKSIDLVYVSYEMLEGDVGYIYISEFETNTFDQFTEAVKTLQAQGMKGLILDIRQNPGGAVSEAVNIADSLLPKATIIYTMDKSGEKNVYKSDSQSLGLPLVVLIDGYSASSSEILTTALQGNKAAVVVGEKSYGKGIMQILVPLSDGSLYKYTFAEYFGPNDTPIHGIGITPDYVVSLPNEYKNVLIEDIPAESDTQLQKALETVNEMIGI